MSTSKSYEQIKQDSYKRLCSAFLRSKGLRGTEIVGEQTILELMIEFTDRTGKELNRVVTDTLVDYVQTAVKQVEVLDWVRGEDEKKVSDPQLPRERGPHLK